MTSSRPFVVASLAALAVAFLSQDAARADTLIVESSVAGDRPSALPASVIDELGGLSGADLQQCLRVLSPPTYSMPARQEIRWAKKTVVEDCEGASTSELERALRILERGQRSSDSDVMQDAYDCLLHDRLNHRGGEGEALVGRAASTLPPPRAETFRRRWERWFRIRDQALVDVQIVLPVTAGIFINGSYFYPLSTSSTDVRQKRRVLHRKMVPGEYFVQVEGFPPTRLIVSRQAPSLLVFSHALRKVLRGGGLRYPSRAERNDHVGYDAALLAYAVHADTALVYWSEGTTVHLSLVSASAGPIRHVAAPLAAVAGAARRLLSGAMPPQTPPSFTQPRPGRAPVTFASTRSQRIAVQSTSLWRTPLRRGAGCKTPCTLYLPPGRTVISSGGLGVSDAVHTVSVADTGNELRLRSPSKRWNTAGKLITLLAGSTLVATGSVFIATCAGADALYDSIPGLPDNDSRCPMNKATALTLASSALVTGVGAGIWFWNRAGIAHNHRLAAHGTTPAPQARTAAHRAPRAVVGLAPSPDGIVGTLRVRF